MLKTRYKKAGKPVTDVAFMWVLGVGYKKYTYNHDGENVSVVQQWILPFCMVERIIKLQKQITL